MPLLTAETNLYPADLFEPGAESNATDCCWWVLHARPRQEKALTRQLLEHQVPFYLPVISRRLRLRSRRVTSYLPLFPGYVFLLANRDQRVTALSTNRVVNTLPVGDQDALQRDLRQIYLLIASGAAVTPEERLAPGSQVEIRSGPLAGLKGKILRTASGHRFVVEVDFIQRGASVLLDDHCLAACC
jgi:transcription antitermination factor NusG